MCVNNQLLSSHRMHHVWRLEPAMVFAHRAAVFAKQVEGRCCHCNRPRSPDERHATMVTVPCGAALRALCITIYVIKPRFAAHWVHHVRRSKAAGIVDNHLTVVAVRWLV